MRAAGKPLVDEVHINSIDRYYMVTATLLGEDHIITTSVDITESRRAQIKAEENEALSSALNQINAYINSTLDSNEIMQRVLEEGAKALNAESSLINMRENDFWVARSVHNFPPSILGQLKTEEESPTSMLVMEERKAVAIEDAYEDERVDRRAMRSFGVRSVLVIPIVLKDEIIGIIAFYHHSRKVHFSDAQIDFANKLAGSLSMAIENARLFETVKESEVKYRGLFENIQEVVTLNKYLLDEHGEVIDWAYVDANPAALRFLGRSREEVVGRRFSKLVGEEQRDKFLSIARRVRMTNGPMAHESYSEPLDKYALSITAPLTAEMFINTVLDITDIKRAQRRAEESEERFHTMADNISQFAWMANADGERFWFNKRWLEYTGTTLEEMKGWGWLKVHHPEKRSGRNREV